MGRWVPVVPQSPVSQSSQNSQVIGLTAVETSQGPPANPGPQAIAEVRHHYLYTALSWAPGGDDGLQKSLGSEQFGGVYSQVLRKEVGI